MKLHEDIKFWLKDYLPKEELDGVSSLMFHLAYKYAKGAFVGGLVLGFLAAVLLLRWVS